MSLMAREKGKVELIWEWTYLARCVWITDLWTQLVKSKMYGDKLKKLVRFDFELPTEIYEYEDKETKEKIKTTKMISTQYTNSLSSNGKMRPMLENWRGRKFSKEELNWFNLWNVLGADCQLQVIHSECWQYANIWNLMPLMKWIQVPLWLREKVAFWFNEDEKWRIIWFDKAAFEKNPKWIQEKIMDSEEYKELNWIEELQWDDLAFMDKEKTSDEEFEELISEDMGKRG